MSYGQPPGYGVAPFNPIVEIPPENQVVQIREAKPYKFPVYYQQQQEQAGGNEGGPRIPPVMIETLPEFFIGNRQTMRVQITKQGDLARGILDYGTVTSAEGA